MAFGGVGNHEVVHRLIHDSGRLVGVGQRARFHARQPEDTAADPVDRRDRGRVELHERPLQPANPGGDFGIRGRTLGLGAAEQPGDHMVVAGVGLPPQGIGRLDEPPPHPIAELGRRISRERRDQDPADPQIVLLGELDRDDRRHGIGLARAGARLDDETVGEVVVAEVKVHRVCRCIEA